MDAALTEQTAPLPQIPFGASLGSVPHRAREFAAFILSRHPFVFVETVEEERAERLVCEAATLTGVPLFIWSRTQGVIDSDGKSVDAEAKTCEAVLELIEHTKEQGVYILFDACADLERTEIQRTMKDHARLHRHTVFVIDDAVKLPADLKSFAELYVLPRPDRALLTERIRLLVSQLAERGLVAGEISDELVEDFARAMLGLTLDEVGRVLTQLVLDDGALDEGDVRRAMQLKGDLLAKGGALEVHTPTVTLDDIVGFTEFKRWTRPRGAALLGTEPDLDPPRGVILTGVPGCGKSLAAKALAGSWGVPLLRLDAGALFDKWIGETERKLRDALATAEALAPSILWLDEIEKGFAVTGPSSGDGGLGYRLVGTLATWMQERTAPVFLFATSNDITLLPPELTRQGRFDDIFFVDLPDHQARSAMFVQLLGRRGVDAASLDLDHLAGLSEGFSGSEIEQSVLNGRYSAAAEGRPLDGEVVAAELVATRPLSRVSPEKVLRIRAWGEEHARPA